MARAEAQGRYAHPARDRGSPAGASRAESGRLGASPRLRRAEAQVRPASRSRSQATMSATTRGPSGSFIVSWRRPG